ncbi:hypothetical protein FIA58_007355 [Flavobacterium jejuense]|uniref:Uncharacterized protein n=1 Tax=Flavobacterium jejuense TaxID=1544455 RepID=A0ABX0INW2_9FLAO|nr:hypothetical protein [Flavobacterium jejuense]NHN25490.1 hypothetical protein [Flavobacterium jejuense]
MQKSIETRWLLNSNEFNTLEHWFNQKDIHFKTTNDFPRQDYYLKLVKSTNLGIKIREPKLVKNEQKSKLEVKLLIKDNGAQKFNNNNQGIVNTWEKYSFETIGNEPETEKIIALFVFNGSDLNSWIKIEKDRLLIKFDTENKKLVSADSLIHEGSGIELTRFKIENKVYYSLGIETFSNSKKEVDNFNQTTDFIFNTIKITGLNGLKSLSYPEIISNHFL